ncbi:MAG: hypothetical protein ACO1O6_08115 [Bacteroidota bacterium]
MKHILFINPNKDTFTNPTLVTLFEQLSVHPGIRVSLLTQEQLLAAPGHLNKIKQFYFPVFGVTWPKKIWTWLPKLKAQKEAERFCQEQQVSVIVAVDPVGLIVGGRLKKRFPEIKLHYLSFELFFSDELAAFPYYRKIKQKEVYYSRLIDCLLIQDEERRDLLLRENKISLSAIKSFLLPVSPAASVTDPASGHEWRGKLGIAENQFVIIHSGSLEKWSGGNYLLELLQNGLPENVLLLIHSKEKLEASNPVHSELLDFKAKGYPLLIHETVFEDYADYLGFLQAADLALALYEADDSSPYTGKNIAHIGLASGKFSCYMSRGVPAIVTRSASYEQLLDRYDFGYVIHTMADIRGIVVSLSKEQLERKKKEALKLYTEILDPAKTCSNYVRYLHG